MSTALHLMRWSGPGQTFFRDIVFSPLMSASALEVLSSSVETSVTKDVDSWERLARWSADTTAAVAGVAQAPGTEVTTTAGLPATDSSSQQHAHQSRALDAVCAALVEELRDDPGLDLMNGGGIATEAVFDPRRVIAGRASDEEAVSLLRSRDSFVQSVCMAAVGAVVEAESTASSASGSQARFSQLLVRLRAFVQVLSLFVDSHGCPALTVGESSLATLLQCGGLELSARILKLCAKRRVTLATRGGNGNSTGNERPGNDRSRPRSSSTLDDAVQDSFRCGQYEDVTSSVQVQAAATKDADLAPCEALTDGDPTTTFKMEVPAAGKAAPGANKANPFIEIVVPAEVAPSDFYLRIDNAARSKVEISLMAQSLPMGPMGPIGPGPAGSAVAAPTFKVLQVVRVGAVEDGWATFRLHQKPVHAVQTFRLQFNASPRTTFSYPHLAAGPQVSGLVVLGVRTLDGAASVGGDDAEPQQQQQPPPLMPGADGSMTPGVRNPLGRSTAALASAAATDQGVVALLGASRPNDFVRDVDIALLAMCTAAFQNKLVAACTSWMIASPGSGDGGSVVEDNQLAACLEEQLGFLVRENHLRHAGLSVPRSGDIDEDIDAAVTPSGGGKPVDEEPDATELFTRTVRSNKLTIVRDAGGSAGFSLRFNDLTVTNVIANSAAAKRGLRDGLHVAAVNGQPVTTFKEYVGGCLTALHMACMFIDTWRRKSWPQTECLRWSRSGTYSREPWCLY